MQRRRTKSFIKVAVVLVRKAYDRHYAIVLAAESSVGKKEMYPMLARMHDDGWLAEGWEPQPPSEMGQPRPARRYYMLTDFGRERIVEFLGDLAPPLPPRPQVTADRPGPSPTSDRIVLMNEKEASQVGLLDQAIPLGEDARLVQVCADDWPQFTQRLAELGVAAVATGASYTSEVRVYASVHTVEASKPCTTDSLVDPNS